MDLTTDYLGLKLKSPLVASASPLNTELDNLLRLQAAGAGRRSLTSTGKSKEPSSQGLRLVISATFTHPSSTKPVAAS